MFSSYSINLILLYVPQVAADESVLQLLSPSCLNDIKVFIKTPTPVNASRLVSAPAIYNWLGYEFIEGDKGLSTQVVDICCWLYETGSNVLGRLISYPVPAEKEAGEINEEDWQKVSGN